MRNTRMSNLSQLNVLNIDFTITITDEGRYMR